MPFRDNFDDPNSALSGYLCGGRVDFGLDHQRLGIQVRKVELEFRGAVVWIQRSGHGATGNGKKPHRHLRAVGKDYRYFVVAVDAKSVQASQNLMDLREQTSERQGNSFRR